MKPALEPVVINGSHGEGGGALLRTALSMSALTQQPVRLHSIRGALRKQGLNSEDLTFLSALATATDAEVTGDELDSKELVFAPRRPPRALVMRLDTGSFQKGGAVGSVGVIAQSLLPVLARTGAYSQLTIVGETYGNSTISFDALERTTLSVHREQGVYAFASMAWAGFTATARGEVVFEVEPSVPLPLAWDSRGELLACRAVVAYAEVSDDIVQRGLKRVQECFKTKGKDVDVEAYAVRSRAPGVSVTVWAEFERGRGSGTALGQRGVRMENVVDSAFGAFSEWFDSTATLDAYLADQVLPLAVMAEGKTIFSTPRITRRLVTVAWVIKQFIPVHITIKGQEGYPGTVTVER